MKLFVQFGCFKENFHSAIVENAEMIPTNFIPTVVSANQHAMVGLSKTNQEKGLYPKYIDTKIFAQNIYRESGSQQRESCGIPTYVESLSGISILWFEKRSPQLR